MSATAGHSPLGHAPLGHSTPDDHSPLGCAAPAGAAPDGPTLRIAPFSTPTARLALKPESTESAEDTESAEGTKSTPQGTLGGAWWPRSRDLAQELSVLADVLESRWGRITRIAVNPRYWPILPPKLPVNGRVVKVGWFTSELDAHQILLLSPTAGRRDLLVIPPEADAPAAARLMAAACESTGTTADALMAAEHALHGISVAAPTAELDYTAGAAVRVVQALAVDR